MIYSFPLFPSLWLIIVHSVFLFSLTLDIFQLEQAKTYEERRKIRSRLRELMADRAGILLISLHLCSIINKLSRWCCTNEKSILLWNSRPESDIKAKLNFWKIGDIWIISFPFLSKFSIFLLCKFLDLTFGLNVVIEI